MKLFALFAGALLAAVACHRPSTQATSPVADEQLFANEPIAPRTTFCNPIDPVLNALG